MLSARKQWMAAIGLMLVVGATLAWQQHHNQSLQARIRQISGDRGTPMAGRTISASELQRLRDDRVAFERLRKEIEELKQAAGKRPPASSSPKKVSHRMPISAWKHAGRTSPEDAIITILWASKNRNLDVISSALAFDSDGARTRAGEILATLPVGTREFLGTPERLMAQLIAQTMDFDAIQFLGEPWAQDNPLKQSTNEPRGATTVVLQAAAHHANKAPSRMTLSLQPALDGWKLVVPEDAIDAYAARLRDGTLKLP